MELELKVIIKNVYGKELVYPACDKSKAFCKAVGTSTFTDANIAAVKALGYRLRLILDPKFKEIEE